MPRKEAKKPFVKESEIQSQILRYLDKKKILYWRQALGGVAHSVNGRIIYKKNPMKGFPDIAGLHMGLFFTVEVKSEKGRMSVEQKEWLLDLSSQGAMCLTAKRVEDVIEFIETLEKSGEDCL